MKGQRAEEFPFPGVGNRGWSGSAVGGDRGDELLAPGAPASWEDVNGAGKASAQGTWQMPSRFSSQPEYGGKKAGLQVRPRSEASLAAVSLVLMPLGKLRTRGGKTSYLAVLEHSGW